MKYSNNPELGTIVGALVADAASVGFHWLYDQERIKHLAPEHPEFHPPASSDYVGISGYFAHGLKKAGDFSQYGEQTMVLLRSLVANAGKYDKTHYENLFCEHFGYGGQYVGYIDHPTKDTLNNITVATVSGVKTTNSAHEYHGADDQQLPALAKLPPLIAVYQGNKQLKEVVESAVRVTNNNDLAVEFGLAAATLIEAVIAGDSPEKAIAQLSLTTNTEIKELIQQASSYSQEDNLSVTSKFGTACKLVNGFPSTIHNILTADSYTAAIRKNIYAGGDSCGRAILLGSVLGAWYGVGGENGVPIEWIEKLTQREEVEYLITELSSL